MAIHIIYVDGNSTSGSSTFYAPTDDANEAFQMLKEHWPFKVIDAREEPYSYLVEANDETWNVNLNYCDEAGFISGGIPS